MYPANQTAGFNMLFQSVRTLQGETDVCKLLKQGFLNFVSLRVIVQSTGGWWLFER